MKNFNLKNKCFLQRYLNYRYLLTQENSQERNSGRMCKLTSKGNGGENVSAKDIRKTAIVKLPVQLL